MACESPTGLIVMRMSWPSVPSLLDLDAVYWGKSAARIARDGAHSTSLRHCRSLLVWFRFGALGLRTRQVVTNHAQRPSRTQTEKYPNPMLRLDSFTYLSVLGAITSVCALALGLLWVVLSGAGFADSPPLFVMVGFLGMMISFPCAFIGAAWSLLRRQQARNWNLVISVIAGAGTIFVYHLIIGR